MGRYTPYHKASADYAVELCKGTESQIDKYKTVTNWITRHVLYDYVRAANPKLRTVYPDIDYTWQNKRGICADVSALAVNMLRVVGINAYVSIGYAGKTWHAWAEAVIDGKTYIYDHQATASRKKTTHTRVHVCG